MSGLLLFLGACGYQVKIEKKEEDTSAEIAENASDCPDEVPEEYQFVWDCRKDCDGSAVVYRYTTGESSDDGGLQLTQQWFVFDGVESCVIHFRLMVC